MLESEPLFWKTNGSRRAQSAERQIGLPPGTTFFLAIAWATAVSWAQVVGAFMPTASSADLLTSIASGDQSFGKPYCLPPTLKAFSRLG